jgi:hypothetical protein
MIIHSYLTDGFYAWAKIFLKSFKETNGVDLAIVLSTFNLNDKQVDELYKCYENLTVENSQYNIEEFSRISGVPTKTLLKYKDEIEKQCVNNKNKVWKLMVAGDKRVKTVRDIVSRNINGEYVLHFDIDMYFRRDLTNLFNLVDESDVAIITRMKSKENRKLWITIQGYKPSEKSLMFLNRWIYYIDKLKPADRPLGYGQTSCYYAYRDTINNIKFTGIPKKFASPIMNPKAYIWSGNTPDGKVENLKKFENDFDKTRSL